MIERCEFHKHWRNDRDAYADLVLGVAAFIHRDRE